MMRKFYLVKKKKERIKSLIRKYFNLNVEEISNKTYFFSEMTRYVHEEVLSSFRGFYHYGISLSHPFLINRQNKKKIPAFVKELTTFVPVTCIIVDNHSTTGYKMMLCFSPGTVLDEEIASLCKEDGSMFIISKRFSHYTTIKVAERICNLFRSLKILRNPKERKKFKHLAENTSVKSLTFPVPTTTALNFFKKIEKSFQEHGMFIRNVEVTMFDTLFEAYTEDEIHMVGKRLLFVPVLDHHFLTVTYHIDFFGSQRGYAFRKKEWHESLTGIDKFIKYFSLEEFRFLTNYFTVREFLSDVDYFRWSISNNGKLTEDVLWHQFLKLLMINSESLEEDLWKICSITASEISKERILDLFKKICLMKITKI